MNIEWKKVTWYSKALALGLFVALPFIGFWLGIKYDRSIGPLEFSKDTPDINNPATTQSSTNSVSDLTAERPKTIIGGTVMAFEANKEFTLKNLPNVTFRVKNVSRITGAKKISICGSTGLFIYIPHPNDPSAIGTCIPERTLTVSGKKFGLVALELEIANQSNAYVNSRFLQVFYNPETGDDIDSKLAVPNPVLTSYGTLPFSTRKTIVTFLIPENQGQVQLIYGDYGKDTGIPESQESLLGKSVSGWIVHFKDKTVSDIPG